MLSATTLRPFARVPPSFSTGGSRMALPPSVRITVVGDVHDQWDLDADTKALQFLTPDLVLFSGYFGGENVDVVRSVANLEFAKAVILGNHDSWYTQQFFSNLGEEHVAYRLLDFPLLKLSVVGGRPPFSCGGDRLFRKKLYRPGLGSNIDDICGKDWLDEGGNNGDPDLAEALSKLKDGTELHMPLVVFGHMHKELAYGKGHRKMIVRGDDGIIYLNGAIVPRVRPVTGNLNDGQSTTDGGSRSNAPEPDGAL